MPRPKGSKNKATLEIRDLAQKLTSGDKAYMDSLRERIKSGKAPHIETLFWQYAYGSPKKQLELTGKDGEALVFTLDLNVIK